MEVWLARRVPKKVNAVKTLIVLQVDVRDAFRQNNVMERQAHANPTLQSANPMGQAIAAKAVRLTPNVTPSSSEMRSEIFAVTANV